MTSRVSTRTSRSAVSETSAAASGAAGFASSAGVAAGNAVPPAGAALPANAGDDDAEVSAGRPFSTGFTNRACHAYRTINARKMARRTRRSIQQAGLEPDTPSRGWYWVVARGTQRVTAREAPGGKPGCAKRAVSIDGFRRIVRARGQEPAGAREVGQNQDLVASKRGQTEPYGRPPVSGPGGGGVRRCFGNQLQGCSG